MNTVHDNARNRFSGKNRYILAALVIAVPVYIITHSYIDAIHINDDEAVSFAATVCFVAGIFAGRYIAQIWISRSKVILGVLIVALVILIAANISWLFIHDDFPLEGRPAINFLLFWLPFVIISLALGMLVKIVRSITQNQLKEAQASAATSKSELHLLQSQLSPHFLFNTLNNLYGLSISQHEKIPALLLKLSELLRYSVYEANEIYAPLKDEVAYIRNYIDFEKIRIGDRLILTMDLEEINNTDIKIAPMLLIVFIENAFKHSKNTVEEEIFVDIQLKTWGSSILFSVMNSFTKQEIAGTIDKNSGFGLTSVTKRLQLLYPKEHELTIKNEAPFYKVLLQLKMK